MLMQLSRVSRIWLVFLSLALTLLLYTTIMRARHTAHSTPNFPVYSAAFLSPTELILGGGGGASKTGIKNKLVRYSYTSAFNRIPHFFP